MISRGTKPAPRYLSVLRVLIRQNGTTGMFRYPDDVLMVDVLRLTGFNRKIKEFFLF